MLSKVRGRTGGKHHGSDCGCAPVSPTPCCGPTGAPGAPPVVGPGQGPVMIAPGQAPLAVPGTGGSLPKEMPKGTPPTTNPKDGASLDPAAPVTPVTGSGSPY